MELQVDGSMSFEEFVKQYNKYPHAVCSTYHVVRDTLLKQESEKLCLIDGQPC